MEALQLHSNSKFSWSSGSPFASRLGGSGWCPGDAPTITMEQGSPVSNVLLQHEQYNIHKHIYIYIYIFIYKYIYI